MSIRTGALLALVCSVGCAHKPPAPSAAQASASEELAQRLDPQTLGPLTVPRTVPHVSVNDAVQLIASAAGNQTWTQALTLSDFDDPQFQPARLVRDVLLGVATLERQREGRACDPECKAALMVAYRALSTLVPFEQSVMTSYVVAAFGEPVDAALRDWVAATIITSPQRLRAMAAQLLRADPEAPATLLALEAVAFGQGYTGEHALAVHVARWLEEHTAPSSARSVDLADLCFRALLLECGRSAKADAQRLGADVEKLDAMEALATDAVALSPDLGLDAGLKLASDYFQLHRYAETRTLLRTLIAEYPDDARAAFSLVGAMQEYASVGVSYDLLAGAGPANRPAELDMLAADFWVSGMITALMQGEEAGIATWLARAPRLHDIMNDYIAFVPSVAIPIALLIDTLTVVASGDTEASRMVLADAQLRAAAADQRRIAPEVMGRLRLNLSVLDADNARAASTIADVQSRYPLLANDGRVVLMARGVAWNDDAMLAALEKQLASIKPRTPADDAWLTDVRAARAYAAPPKKWAAIAAAYGKVAGNDERLLHNLRVAELRANTGSASVAPVRREANDFAARLGPGMPGVVCKRSFELDPNPLFARGDIRGRDVLTFEAALWLEPPEMQRAEMK